MEKIVDSLSAHEWTIFTFILAIVALLIIPFKGESALTTILTYLKNRKQFETQLIEKYQAIANGLQEENRVLRERIVLLEKKEDEQEEEIKVLQKTVHQLELKLTILEGK